MALYEEILLHALKDEREDSPTFSSKCDCVVEKKCYEALQKIKTILENDQLDDRECFQKIEAIVETFEEMGSGCGNRHDFG